MRITVLIPARNEVESLPLVLADLPREMLHEVIVVDNGSTDGTGEVARRGEARVVREERPGYGRACLAGLAAMGETDVVVFLDADYSDHPEELTDVVRPILEGRADVVIGSRVLGERERGALLPQARFGNLLAVSLIRRLRGQRYTDLGPFRAIRKDALDLLGMADEDFGWTVELQVKAPGAGLRSVEVPVRYRRRIGVSKITGTVRGSVLAGIKILGTIARHHRWRPARPPRRREPPTVSAIVPVLDEEGEVGGVLEALAAPGGPDETIVVDGGSRDRTREIAGSFSGVRVIETGRGRARQMNEGAAAARGEVLWFLHADCRPAPGATCAIRDGMRAPHLAGGAFSFRLRTHSPGLRLVETIVRLRNVHFREPYGDQGIFVRRSGFEAAGGYPDVPILEDIRFVRTIRRRGGFRVLPIDLPTSARRWEEEGVLRTMLRFQSIAALERLRLPAGWLARMRR